jgi:uncharacterized protein
MRWTPGGRSEDLEDQRSSGAGFGGFGGGGGGGIRIGLGGILLLGVLSLIFRRDLITPFLGGGDPISAPAASDPARDASEERSVQFVSFVLDDNQKTWERIFSSSSKEYRHAKLVLFRDAVNSACGFAQAATGPFYCPGDEKVYLDLGFFDELHQRFGAPGDFAQAYVISHEIGHHIQKLLGIERQVRRLQQQSPDQQNPLSVRMELQADCFAGIWGHSTEQRKILEAGDVEEALGAASSVGDDHIQKMARGRVAPESFTHGSSQQRMQWFQNGFRGGDVQACDTFNSRQ